MIFRYERNGEIMRRVKRTTSEEIDKFILQDQEYRFPYHYIFSFSPYKVNLSNNLRLYSAILLKKVLSRIIEYHHETGKPLRILDFGCGDGRLIWEILKLYNQGMLKIKKIVGVDLSERAILFAKAFTYDNRDIVELYDKDLRKLKLKDKFDVIVAMEVLEHIPDKDIESTIEALHKLLDDKEIFIITVPSIFMRKPKKHYRHYNYNLLREQVNKFFEIQEWYYHIRKFPFELYIRLLSNRFFAINSQILLKILDKTFGKLVESQTKKGLNLFAVFVKRKR